MSESKEKQLGEEKRLLKNNDCSGLHLPFQSRKILNILIVLLILLVILGFYLLFSSSAYNK